MKARLYRARARTDAARVAPPSVHRILAAPGRGLDPSLAAPFEQRLGHRFGGVRIHDDAEAARSAAEVGAAAYTVGRHIVFGAGRFAPEGRRGLALLGHELTHVAQQRATSHVPAAGALEIDGAGSAHERQADRSSAAILGGRAPGAVGAASGGLALQRDDEEDEERRAEGEEMPDPSPMLDRGRFRLREPTLRWPGVGSESRYRLRLDPDIQAQLDAMAMVRRLLAPGTIASRFGEIDWSFLDEGTHPALRPPFTPTPERAPLVPRGRGPATPRAGNPGDVLRAVMRIPAISSGIDRLRDEAASTARREWRRLSTGERALLIGHTVLLGGGALAAVATNPEARGFVLEQVQGRNIPVPGVPGLSVRFNLTGPDQNVHLGLDIAALLRGR